MKTRFGFLPVLAALCILPMAAQAQGDICQDRSRLVDTLIYEFGEQLAEVHRIGSGELLEFHISPAVGTWTALVTDTSSQVSCVLGAGGGLNPYSFENTVEGGVNI